MTENEMSAIKCSIMLISNEVENGDDGWHMYYLWQEFFGLDRDLYTNFDSEKKPIVDGKEFSSDELDDIVRKALLSVQDKINKCNKTFGGYMLF